VPLVTACYLVIVETADELKNTLVSKPSQNMIDWFRAMLGPVQLRPMFPAVEVGRMFHINPPRKVIDICERLHLPVYDDPVFGGLVSPKTIFTLHRMYLEVVAPLRVDRQSLITVLARLRGRTVTRDRNLVHIYFTAFDKEIKRIARLMEPQRTIAATAFWQAFNDAETFVGVIPEDSPQNTYYGKLYRKMMEKARGVEKILKGKSTWEKKPYKLTGRRAYSPRWGWYDRKAALEAMSKTMTEYHRKRKAAAAALRKKD